MQLHHLHTKKLGRHFLYFDSLGSTNDYLKEHEADVDAFMDAYKNSVEFVNSDTEAAAEIIGNHDIISAEVAVKAIPQCSIVFMEGYV